MFPIYLSFNESFLVKDKKGPYFMVDFQNDLSHCRLANSLTGTNSDL